MLNVSNDSAVRPGNSMAQQYLETLNTVAVKLSGNLEQAVKTGRIDDMMRLNSQSIEKDVNQLAKEYINSHIGEIIRNPDKDRAVKQITDAINKDLRGKLISILNSHKQDSNKGMKIWDEIMNHQKGVEALKAIVGKTYDQLKKPVLYGPGGAESGGILPG